MLVYGIRHVQVFSLALNAGANYAIDYKLIIYTKLLDGMDVVKIRSAITRLNVIVLY